MAGALTIVVVIALFFVAGGLSAAGILATVALWRARRQQTRPWLGKASSRNRWR
jgi:NhaP-type Na+/H+ or K+/H+ antiporter